ncbi:MULTISPECIES: gamma carbonic anhydrase family protein [Persicobacter]|uniref:Gamma carbonic anhydrase family protein n=1 Tax=Persicobacter diffluens TaxID=981 RepID=A0AAN4VWK5_9BACT|nr:gamma carbonic anhydrase family protein [Persicobacter sp. CCB-QB2]GJM61043.1 gamma carbonic anhydrase family protein [Persicobacter diffluens]
MALIKTIRGNVSPKFGKNVFLADNATVIGEVELGDNCSVWFNAVVRGDVHYIKVGDNTNIQDLACIHCSYQTHPTTIGSNVTIGHKAMIHGCTIEDNCLIGMNSVLLDGVVVKEGAIVAAGAVVLENTVVESGTIYAGIPAKKVKEIGDRKEMIQRIGENYYQKYATWYKEEE